MSEVIRAALALCAAIADVTPTPVDNKLVAFARSNEEFIVGLAEWILTAFASETEPERLPILAEDHALIAAVQKEGFSATDLMTLAGLLFQFVKLFRKKG